MKSLLGAPFQMINMAAEVLFILDHRLRDQVENQGLEESFSQESKCRIPVFQSNLRNTLYSDSANLRQCLVQSLTECVKNS